MKFIKLWIISILSLIVIIGAVVAYFPMPDVTPPIVTLSTSATEIPTGETLVVTAVAVEAGPYDTGVNTLKILENGAVVSSKSCGGARSCSLSTERSNPMGTYTYKAQATDMAGHTGESNTVSVDFNVDPDDKDDQQSPARNL